MKLQDIDKAEMLEETELLSNDIDYIDHDIYLVEQLRAQYRTYARDTEGSGLSDDMNISLGW